MNFSQTLARWTVLLTLAITPAFAGPDVAPDPKSIPPITKEPVHIDQEFFTEFSYVAPGNMRQGNADIGNVEETTVTARYLIQPMIKNVGILRLGGEYFRASYTLPNAAKLPNTLQSGAAIIGFDTQIGDHWLFRIDAMPGVYSDFDDISWDDVNVPVVLGGSYLVNKDLQIFFGLSIDPWREWVALPGAGLRWKFAENWTLNAIPPKPRIEYQATKQLTIFAGADFKTGTFRSGEQFGSNHGEGQKLNNTVISYTEIRTGAGISYNILPTLTLDLEGGAMLYRDIDFHRADLHIRTNEPAAYGQIGLKGTF
ncbi:MAG: DUF6268 family outer membrane beta-barrel protein [Candidatus Methylacidiphilales bacterium]|nr:DUF6268 family outer membrane beta-barrel protein [Candidatus Methylacidiphilales bacterium]